MARRARVCNWKQSSKGLLLRSRRADALHAFLECLQDGRQAMGQQFAVVGRRLGLEKDQSRPSMAAVHAAQGGLSRPCSGRFAAILAARSWIDETAGDSGGCVSSACWMVVIDPPDYPVAAVKIVEQRQVGAGGSDWPPCAWRWRSAYPVRPGRSRTPRNRCPVRHAGGGHCEQAGHRPDDGPSRRDGKPSAAWPCGRSPGVPGAASVNSVLSFIAT